MKKTSVYLDCGSGVAGDMLIGAMIDLGLSVKELNKTLHRAIPFKNWEVVSQRTERQGWPGRTVVIKGDRYFGSGDKMKQVIRRSPMSRTVQANALETINRLLVAEKLAHGRDSKGRFDPDGLGLLDTLVDILGSAWGFWRLGLENVSASAVNAGRIAPATAQILEAYQIPSYSSQSQYELATPTGLAILSVITNQFGPRPLQTMGAAGYGAGLKDIPGLPNVLAIYRGRTSPAAASRPLPTREDWGETIPLEQIVVLETVIDDMDPRLYPHISDLLMKAGALDVWWISAGMKKGRPGTAYSILCRPEKERRLVRILFDETTTLGIRRLPMERWTLSRHSSGMMKIAQLSAGRTKKRVEYELARRKAVSHSTPLRNLLK